MGDFGSGFYLGRSAILSKEIPCRIVHTRSEEKHSLAPLWKAECPGIDYSVRPAISQSLQVPNQVTNAAPSIELKQERHILDQHPRGAAHSHEPKNISNQTRLPPENALGAAGLRKILAWKSGHEQVNASWQRGDLMNVRFDRNARETVTENGLRAHVDLAGQQGHAACLLQSELDTPNARE
ncbi:MAG: hypothetical protein WBW73_05625 [Rhodoplanes sp.]